MDQNPSYWHHYSGFLESEVVLKVSYKLPISVFRPNCPFNTFLGYLICKSNRITLLIKTLQWFLEKVKALQPTEHAGPLSKVSIHISNLKSLLYTSNVRLLRTTVHTWFRTTVPLLMLSPMPNTPFYFFFLAWLLVIFWAQKVISKE